MTIIQEQCSLYIAELKERFPDLTSTLPVKAKTTIVEAFLFNYPLPQVVLLETNYAKYEFLKGEQVIGALLYFYNGKFKLTNTIIEGYKFVVLQDNLWERFTKKRIPASVLLTDDDTALPQITKFRDRLKEINDSTTL